MGYIPPTQGGYNFGEVTSSFQKSIRRGMEEDALYWAVELDKSGYGEYVWKRMRIISSEDIGLAEPFLPAVIRALYENWVQAHKKNKGTKYTDERLFIVHGVLLLVRAKKSRLVDHANIAHYLGDNPRREILDVALDKHTARGRSMKRGFDHFFEEGIKLENEDPAIPDIYLERAKEAMCGIVGTQNPDGTIEMFDEEETSAL